LSETREDWNPEIRLLLEERNQTHAAELSRLRDAITKLSPADQLLIRLLYPEGVQEGFLQELSRPDVAQHLQITENALKVRHFRAIRRLRRILKVKHDRD
jgi:RNA polymerase sigma factor (sigma-70 family)